MGVSNVSAVSKGLTLQLKPTAKPSPRAKGADGRGSFSPSSATQLKPRGYSRPVKVLVKSFSLHLDVLNFTDDA